MENARDLPQIACSNESTLGEGKPLASLGRRVGSEALRDPAGALSRRAATCIEGPGPPAKLRPVEVGLGADELAQRGGREVIESPGCEHEDDQREVVAPMRHNGRRDKRDRDAATPAPKPPNKDHDALDLVSKTGFEDERSAATAVADDDDRCANRPCCGATAGTVRRSSLVDFGRKTTEILDPKPRMSQNQSARNAKPSMTGRKAGKPVLPVTFSWPSKHSTNARTCGAAITSNNLLGRIYR